MYPKLHGMSNTKTKTKQKTMKIAEEDINQSKQGCQMVCFQTKNPNLG
jgi:hypothetical protein